VRAIEAAQASSKLSMADVCWRIERLVPPFSVPEVESGFDHRALVVGPGPGGFEQLVSLHLPVLEVDVARSC
jgi:hypothetical protein